VYDQVSRQHGGISPQDRAAHAAASWLGGSSFCSFFVGFDRTLKPFQEAGHPMNDKINPFFAAYDAPFAAPPLDQIKPEHFLPAFERGMSEHLNNIETICSNEEGPTFANSLDALERASASLSRVTSVFYNLTSAHTNDAIQAIQTRMAPKFVQHNAKIQTNARLFSRIDTLFQDRANLSLNAEQKRVLEETHKSFVRAGAALSKSDQDELKSINEEISILTTRFGQNSLAETNDFQMVLEDDDMVGLSDAIRASASETAKELGEDGKFVFTTSRSSFTPFMQFSDNRELREKMFHAYTHSGDNNNENDNKNIAAKIASLRVRRANIMGFKTHGAFELDNRMAGSPDAAYGLLRKLWDPAVAKAKREAADLQACIQDNGGNFELAPWDWWYYTEKLRKQNFDLDADELAPYFELSRVRDGAFYVATQLYGLTFKRRHDVPVYHQDVETWEVSDADGSHIGLFLADYFMRPSKRGGAWMSSYRDQSKLDGEVRPIIVNVCNFPKASEASPSLLGSDEVRTLFHEFGHALHGLLANVTYESLSGTSVKRDFVELPSQIMEHWASEPDVLKVYAHHYETDEVIPDELIEKLLKVKTFNQGFATTEYLAASILDMDWHSLEETDPQATNKFEKQSMTALGLVDEIAPRYRSTYFSHIFSGGYSAGYYSYIWAEVLDADGYEAFTEKGIFDAETAKSFRKNILEKGGTEDPMTLYKKFRGREPEVDALISQRGLD
jgi:peptidyl-dipeptidase Dcp